MRQSRRRAATPRPLSLADRLQPFLTAAAGRAPVPMAREDDPESPARGVPVADPDRNHRPWGGFVSPAAVAALAITGVDVTMPLDEGCET